MHLHHHDHGHGHHGPDDPSRIDRTRFLAAAAILTVFLVVQVIGGVVFNSLALLSDSVHMLGDIGAILLALTAARLAARPVSGTRTYGMGRAELLAALINGATLLGAATWILIEGVRRLGSGTGEVDGLGVLVVATAGLLANIVAAWLLASAARDNINARAAMQHALLDAASSVAVIAGGLAIWLGGWTIVDPLLGILIGIVAALGGLRTLRAASNLLLDAVPPGIDLDELGERLLAHPGVRELHDLHVWSIGARRTALTAHLLIGAQADPATVVEELRAMLAASFDIDHVTLQVLPRSGEHPMPIRSRLRRDDLG